jgi:hypothetical protein
MNDLQRTWDLLARQPASPQGYATIRITKELRQQIREQLGLFEIVIGDIRIPVLLDSELPSGVMILRSH